MPGCQSRELTTLIASLGLALLDEVVRRGNVPRPPLCLEANMAQNIYDNPDLFAGYSQLPRQVHGLEGAPE